MAKRGRPTKYNEKFHVKLAYAYSRLGYTDEEMAKEFGVSESTLNLWKKKHESFFGALKKGKDTPDDQVESALLKRALGFKIKAVKLFQHQGKILEGEYNEYYPPDVAAAFIWLKNRRPEKWRDRRQVEMTGNVGITMAEIHAAAAELEGEEG